MHSPQSSEDKAPCPSEKRDAADIAPFINVLQLQELGKYLEEKRERQRDVLEAGNRKECVPLWECNDAGKSIY